MWEGVKVVSRMSEEGLESLDENESKMDGRHEVGQNSSVDDLMRGLEVYKVVHTQKGTVEFIINDHRYGVPKGTAERERKHASEYNDMKKKLEETSRRHAKEMEAKEMEWKAEIKKAVEAKEIEWRAELKEASARFEKEIKGKLQAIEKESKGKLQAMAGEKKAKDALTKARAGSEERKAQLVVAKEQHKKEKEKREKAENLHKSIKLELVKALKECDENRVIQERIDANRESEIVRLTESLEKVERDAAEAEIRHASMDAALVQVVTPLRDDRRKASKVSSLRDDRGKASKMETIEQPEEQNSAVADAKCSDGETETEEDQRVVADDEAEVAFSCSSMASYEKWKKDNPIHKNIIFYEWMNIISVENGRLGWNG